MIHFVVAYRRWRERECVLKQPLPCALAALRLNPTVTAGVTMSAAEELDMLVAELVASELLFCQNRT